jgi:hypothetical protein
VAVLVAPQLIGDDGTVGLYMGEPSGIGRNGFGAGKPKQQRQAAKEESSQVVR